VIIIAHPDGHVAVAQADHARMCGELARCWGNERFGQVEPADEVYLAAEQHELGWAEWDRSPTLDPSTGLPFTVLDLELVIHLPMQIEGPRKLASVSPYAALLASLKHTSMYDRPHITGLLRPKGRQVRSYLDRSRALQAELRTELPIGDAEIERNWRLVRTWDGLSHDLLLERAPCTRREVPAAGGTAVELRLRREDGIHTLDPWPFADDRVRVHAQGRLLKQTFSDQERMRAELAEAPRVTLSYELVRAQAFVGSRSSKPT
jgi:Protein of unknown function (DUF3891)